MSSPLRRVARARAFTPACLAIAFALLSAAPAAAADPPYPRLGLYGHVDGRGWPVIRTNGTLDPVVLDQVARHHVVVLDASPFTEYRPDGLAALRARRSDITLLAYVQGEYAFPSSQADSSVNLPTRLRIVLRNLNGHLYAKHGPEFRNANVNLAKMNAQGRFVVAEAMADFFRDQVLVPGGWDGLFLDRFCNTIGWDQSPTDSIDFVRAGYPTFAAFDAAWLAGTDTLANRLRRRAGNTPVLVGNCGTGTKYVFNGWMRENFPFQGPGTWAANVFGDPGGYVPDQARYRAPYFGWLTAWPGGAGAPADPENMRRARLALATATLADGYGTINPPDINPATGYMGWWFDEYAVELATARATTSIVNTGWLGRPLGPMYRMFWTQPGVEDACALNPGFEGSVVTGWSFLTGNGATVVGDVGTAAVGTFSARIGVPTASGGASAVRYRTTGEILLIPDVYSATFWAKSSSARTIEVAAVRADGTTYVAATCSLRTTWTRHQVRLDGTLGFARLELRVGGKIGSVWFDDVHFQRGATGVWRRNFDHGAVLLNDGNQAWTIALERSFRRISGLLDPTVNDGGSGTTVVLDGGTGIFLVDAREDLVDAGDPIPVARPALAWAAAVPNPCAAGGVVRLTLVAPADRGAQATVDVYDAAGRAVRRLHRGPLAAGAHAFAWDGRDDGGGAVAPGLYFARARVGAAVAVRKLVRRA